MCIACFAAHWAGRHVVVTAERQAAIVDLARLLADDPDVEYDDERGLTRATGRLHCQLADDNYDLDIDEGDDDIAALWNGMNIDDRSLVCAVLSRYPFADGRTFALDADRRLTVTIPEASDP